MRRRALVRTSENDGKSNPAETKASAWKEKFGGLRTFGFHSALNRRVPNDGHEGVRGGKSPFGFFLSAAFLIQPFTDRIKGYNGSAIAEKAMIKASKHQNLYLL